MAAFSSFFEKIDNDVDLRVLLEASYKDSNVVGRRGQKAASLYFDIGAARLLNCFEEIQEENGVFDFPSIFIACDMVSALGGLLTIQVDHECEKVEAISQKYMKLMKCITSSSKPAGPKNRRGRKRAHDPDNPENEDPVNIVDVDTEAWLQEAVEGQVANVTVPRKSKKNVVPPKRTRVSPPETQLKELENLLRQNTTSNACITMLEDVRLQERQGPISTTGDGMNDFVFEGETGMNMADLFAGIPCVPQDGIGNLPPVEIGRADNLHEVAGNETIHQVGVAGDVSISMEQPTVMEYEDVQNQGGVDATLQPENEMPLVNDTGDIETRQGATTAGAVNDFQIEAPPFVTPPRNPPEAPNQASPLILGSLRVEEEPPRVIRRVRTTANIDERTMFTRAQMERAVNEFQHTFDAGRTLDEQRGIAFSELRRKKYANERKNRLAQGLNSLPIGRYHASALLEVCQRRGDRDRVRQEGVPVLDDSQAFNHEALFDTPRDIPQPLGQERGPEENFNAQEHGVQELPPEQQQRLPAVANEDMLRDPIPENIATEQTADNAGAPLDIPDAAQGMEIVENPQDNFVHGLADFSEQINVNDYMTVIKNLTEPTYLSDLFPPTSTFKITLVTGFEYLLELQLERKVAMKQQEPYGPILVRPFFSSQ